MNPLSILLLQLGAFGCGWNAAKKKSPRDIINHLYSTLPLVGAVVIHFIL